MKQVSYLILLTLFVTTINFGQIQSQRKYHAFSGTVGITAEAGTMIGFTDYPDVKPEILARGSIDYFFPTTSAGIIGIRGFYSAGYIGGKGLAESAEYPTTFRTTTGNIGGGITYTFSIAQAVFPYVFLGASYQWFNPKDPSGTELPYGGRSFKETEVNYHGEAGIKFLLSKAISLNISAGAQFSSGDNWDAQPVKGGNDVGIIALAGFTYSIGGSLDADGDGIKDALDKCPDTPEGVYVDDFGCPKDSDNDGVPDYLDKCPDTKAGMAVDKNGCVVDADGDGVADAADKCPNTPKGAKVDAAGCPDSDGDGVADNTDKCADTPKGAAVDNRGCPKDTDGDGVADYQDDCPNTPTGEEVDSRGCSTQKDTVMIKETITLSGDTNFKTSKATLMPAAHSMLSELAASMKANQNTRWRVEGHTDSQGSDSYNMTLSRQRAEAVVNFLVSNGIDRSRFEIAALGESMPIASNDTAEGRAMNRRVEIKLIK